jgi:hypothetical protein
MTSPDPAADAEQRRARAEQTLAAELREKGLDLDELRARIAEASSTAPPPMTEERLRANEEAYRAVSLLREGLLAVRNAGLRQAVAERWTFERIKHATDLSIARIGQLAPRKPKQDTSPASSPSPTRKPQQPRAPKAKLPTTPKRGRGKAK